MQHSSAPISITYLSGAVRREACGYGPISSLGTLFTPLMGNRPEVVGIHAHDNGVFSEFTSGGKKKFSLEKFLTHLDDFAGIQQRCLFAVAPDVIGNWWATLRRSKPVLAQIRARGYRAALVAQNGLEHHMNRIPWADFDVLFLGGGQDARYVTKANPKGEWKLSAGAARLTAEARRRGKDVHMGRVNSLKRLRYAQSIGCTSADGTYIAFGADKNTAKVLEWVAETSSGARTQVASCVICRHHIEIWAASIRKPVSEVLANLPDKTCGHFARKAPATIIELPARVPVKVAA